ncbi:hypothetical protein [Pelagicoccus sp. SDUM812003]|uniref:hypothetical protein n=1 Tax=Pelagicoccus sp. SDUM812003 TaxID=3041267 RepID=UPI00280DFDAB|nr:hypothetical protein [Pelagicoccus sp. SDUM812003]MDQ8205860.1 hypothetical protein [Pelagicoccus sp. SDUM812003]
MHRQQAIVEHESGWNYAESTEGSFSVLMPIPFNDFTVTDVDPKNGTIQTFGIGSKTMEGFKFSVTEIPTKETSDPSDFEKIAESFGESNSTVVSQETSEFKGMRCITVELSKGNSGAYIRYVLGPKSIFTIIIEYPDSGGMDLKPYRDIFFNSLEVKKPNQSFHTTPASLRDTSVV